MSQDLQQYLVQLGQAHGFTVEQLVQNRAGRLHPTQEGRIQGGVGGAIVMFVVGALIFGAGLAGAYLFYDDLSTPISAVDMNTVYLIAGGGAFLSSLFELGGVLKLRKRSQRMAIYRDGGVKALEGPMQKTLIRGKRGVADWHYIHVERRRFVLDRRTWELLTQGAGYRLYVVADELLSLEPVASERSLAGTR